MSEQDDEQWITERLDGVGSCADDMRAAIARGYERGKAEGAAERDRLTSQLANERTKSHDLTTQVTMLRERLAATQVDAPDRLAALEQRVGALIDMEAGVTSGAIGWTEYRTRLAALRAPGVASSEVDGLRAQLADVTRERDVYRRGDERARKAVHELSEERATALRDLATARRERDEALAKVEAQRVTGEAQVDRDVRVSAALKDALGEDGHTHEFDVAIRKITRQRDEALGVVRRYLDWDPKWGDLPKGTLRGIKLDMRALVAGQPVAESKLDAIMTEREADLIGESLATERGLRDQIATRDAEIERLQERCRAAAHALVGAVGSATPANVEELAQRAATEIETLRAKLAEAERCAQESADIMRRARDRAESYCLRLGEAESQRDALRQHALKLDGLCERAADVALRVVAVGKSTPSLVLDLGGLENAIRARGEVPR